MMLLSLIISLLLVLLGPLLGFILGKIAVEELSDGRVYLSIFIWIVSLVAFILEAILFFQLTQILFILLFFAAGTIIFFLIKKKDVFLFQAILFVSLFVFLGISLFFIPQKDFEVSLLIITESTIFLVGLGLGTLWMLWRQDYEA